jgi:RNA polymerase subunit RPABC4/transcription elongation factor Spt4
MGMAGQMMQAPAQAPYNAPPPGPGFAGGGQGYAAQAAAGAQQAAPPPQAPAQPAPDAAAPAGMMACGNCQSPVQVGSKFCPECGTPTQKHCTNCNASLASTAKFCAECGTPTAPRPA